MANSGLEKPLSGPIRGTTVTGIWGLCFGECSYIFWWMGDGGGAVGTSTTVLSHMWNPEVKTKCYINCINVYINCWYKCIY